MDRSWVLGGSLATKCISLDNEPCLLRPIVIDLNCDKLRYYSFFFSLGRCEIKCNNFNNLSVTNFNLSERTYVPNKTKFNMFNMITRIN